MNKTRTLQWQLLALVMPLACACSTTDDDDSGGRGGKADHALYGSCEAACGGQSTNGNCWCDESCTALGDCCADQVVVCAGPSECETEADCKPGFGCAPGPACNLEDTTDCQFTCQHMICGGVEGIPCPAGSHCVLDDPANPSSLGYCDSND